MKKILAVVVALLMVLPFLVACQEKPAEVNATTPPIEVVTEPTKEPEQQPDNQGDTPEVTPEPEPEWVRPTEYVRGDDEERYEAALGEYSALLLAAEQEQDTNIRFLMMAQAEALLLDSAVMIPTTTKGGTYQITRIAYRTVPYVQWGNDDDRLKGIVISDAFIDHAEREELIAAWQTAVAGGAAYDPAAILEAKGHKIQKDYVTTFSTAPVTIDWLNTSSQSDTEVTVNTVDGLVEYNNLGQMMPALAESWDISEDGLTYTFHIRQGVKWYTSEGTEYAPVTANDFVAGFHHMMDAQAGLEWLVEGVVAGASEYLKGGSFDDVGYKAADDATLVVTLVKPTPYFLTMLTYSCFLPICEPFYLAKGGVYGIAEYAEAFADTNKYTYGKSEDVASQVYCGPYLLQKLQKDSEIYLVKNPNYYKPEDVKLDTIKFVYDAGENPLAYYEDTVKGIYAAAGLRESNGTLAKAKEDGNFEKYGYVTDTQSTSYFGGLNLNRGTFALESGACASPKTEDQKIDTDIALNNKHFRQALQFAFDKGTYNAVLNGEDLKYTSLRNMYTHPEFVQLSADVTDADGKTFTAGTMYGEMVQYYLEKLGSPIKVADQIDGWYNPEAAKAALEAAKAELEGKVTFPIYIDVVYGSFNDNITAQANAYKKVIEDTLGAENVVINLVEATTSQDYYACGYRASNGEAGNFDMFYGSGWGPDYGDPSTYLDTFLGEGAGYMTKVIGLF